MAERILIRLNDIKAADSSDVLLIESLIDGGVGPLSFTDPFTNSGVPVTLNQLFSSGVTKWTQLTDAQTTILANQFVVGNATGTGLKFTPGAPGATYDSLTDTQSPKVIDNIPFVNAAGTDHIYQTDVRGDQVKTAEPTQSGIIGRLSGEISVASGTEVLVTSGDGSLTERVTTTHSRPHAIAWGTQNVTVPAPVLATGGGVILLEDTGFTGTGTPQVVTFATATPDYMRTRARLGYTVHDDGVLIDVIDSPNVYKDAGQLVGDLWNILGIEKLDGTGIHTEIVATLTSSQTAMTLVGEGINFRDALGEGNPNSAAVASVALVTFATINGDGDVFNSGLTVFPNTFNSGGTETALTGQRAAVTQVYQLVGGGFVAQLGTTDYQNFDTAVSNIQNETLVNPPPDVIKRAAIRTSFVVINAGATQWADLAAHIFPFTGGIGGTTTPSSSILNVASLELEHSTDLIAVSTSPVLVVYDIVNDGDINGFFSYSAGVLTCLIACRVLILPRLDSTVNSGSSRSGIRLDIRLTDVSVQVFDNNSRSDTVDAPDTQNNGSANIVCAISDTLKIYINSYVTGLSDVWEGANRLQLVILKDLT